MTNVLLALLALSPTMAVCASDQPADARIETAKAFVQLLSRGEFTEAVEEFDQTMQRVLPADKLEQTWRAVTTPFGALQDSSTTRTATADKYDIVFVTCQFERGSLDTKVVFDAEGRIAGLFFVQAGEYRAPDYVTPDTFDEQEITIGGGLWSLPGTLSLPNSAGPLPAVVLVHGSGPLDRDETIGPNKPFRDLAHGLASQGVAVLRYEKRTHHHRLKSALLIARLTVQEETIDDAAAAVETLRSHERIDAEQIFVLGHSLGGNVFPRIADANKNIAGFVSLAGSARPLEDLVLEQTQYILALDGEISEDEQSVLDQLEQQVARVKADDLSTAVAAADLPLGIPATYWLDLRDYRPAEKAKEIDRPMLMLQGERDYQVTMDDFQLWQQALQTRNDVKFISYPHLNHLFIAGEGKSTPAEYTQPGNVDRTVIDDIATWIKKR